MSKAEQSKAQQIRNRIREILWDETSRGPLFSILRWLLRVIVMTAKGFVKDRVNQRASELTYYTMLSIIPVLALAFAIAKGFGLEQFLTNCIIDAGGEANTEVAKYITKFIGTALHNAKGGIVAGVGVVMLLYSVFKLLGNIEEAFNDMWCIKKSRTLIRKVTDYACIMIVAPLLLIISSSFTFSARSTVQLIPDEHMSSLLEVAIGAIPYVLMPIALTLTYLVMPNIKVSLRAAMTAGFVTGIAIQLTQWVFITFQIGVHKAGAIYGSFAFLPLMLTAIQVAWTLVLSGCKISFAVQNASRYNMQDTDRMPSTDLERKMSLLILHKITKAFKEQRPPKSGQEIANELEISQMFFYHIADRLKAAGLVAELANSTDTKRTFIPAVDIADITPSFVCQKLDGLGDDSDFHVLRSADFDKVEVLYNEMKSRGRNNFGNVPLHEI